MGKPRVDYAKVAVLACQAFVEKRSASALISTRFNVTHKHACQLIMRARRKGFYIPKLPKHPINGPREVGLYCSTCFKRFDLTDVLLLKHHVRTEHSRSVAKEELTPR